MFYAKFVIILCLVQGFSLKYTIISKLGSGTTRQVCLSHSTDLDKVLEISNMEMDAINLLGGFCTLGELRREDCSPNVFSNYVVNVHGTIHSSNCKFVDIVGDRSIEVLNDATPDSFTPGAHNCSSFEKPPFWTDLVPKKNDTDPSPSLLSVLPAAAELDFNLKLKEANDKVEAIQRELVAEKARSGRIEDEARTKMRELEDELRRGWIAEREAKELAHKNLEEERVSKLEIERRMHDLDKKLRQSENDADRLREQYNKKRKSEEEVKTPKASTLNATTTLATVVLTSLLATGLAAIEQIEERNTNHILNRPGTGVYMASPTLTQTECSLGYGKECKSWELQVSPLHYPFFTSNVDKYSILESITQEPTLLIKNNNSCELTTSPGSQKQCQKESSTIKKYCTDDARAYFFIDLGGNLSIVHCSNNFVLSEDCNFCISKSGGVGQKIFMPIQDAFCQRGGSESPPVVRYSKDLCSIGLFKIKSCHKSTSRYERMGFIVAGQKKLYLEELKMRYRQEYDEDQFFCYKVKSNSPLQYEKVSPSKCKGVGSQDQKCNGDEYFCNRYPCDTNNPDAHCSLRRHAAVVEVNVGGVWIKPKCVGYEKVLVKRGGLKTEDLSVRECTSCLWECERNKVVVKTHGPKIVSATACSHGSCKSVMQKPSTFLEIPYPGNSEIIGGDIGIHMSERGSPSNIHVVVHCKPKDSCDISDCIFCKHGILNYQCHSVASAVLLSTMIAACLALVGVIVSRSKHAVKFLASVVAIPFKWVSLLTVWVVKNWKLRITRVIRATNDAIGWENNLEQVRVENAARRPQPAVRYAFYGTTILSILSTGLCCSESLIAESSIMQCTTEDSSTVCKATGTVVLKLGPIGSESCLILKGLRDNEKQFISIKTISSELTCREGESFWTSLYTPVCLSSRRCHLMGECTGDICLKWKTNKTSAEFTGKTHSEVIHENKCFEQSGGMGYGCFNVNPSCLMVHSYLKPIYKNAFKVFRCVAWNHRVRLGITTHKRNFEITLMAMSTQQTDWGSIGLILDSEGITGTNSYSFMKHGLGSFAIIDEPYVTEPRKGYLGEVRCPTEETAVKASPSCKVAPGLIEYQPEMDVVECTTNMMDPMAIFNRGSLPQVRDGKTFTQSIEKSSVQALTTGEIHASVRLVLDEYEVEYKVVNNDCDSTFVNITGCYSCDEGARLCVKVKASSDVIYHFTDSDNSMNVLFKVSSNIQDYCIVLHFSKPVVNVEGKYDCGRSKKPMLIKGTLIAMAPHDDRVTNGGSSIIINPKGGGVDFLGWLSGLSSWFGGPLKTFLIIAGFLIVGIIIVIIIIILARLGIQQALAKKLK
ncbi:polyprotein [Punique virus]|uniref:Envelopment polyprotein n=2 Tax=Punique virus TaxID=693015 RepID=R4I3L7_9VIRU|nr:polyprotein [Punique virus]AFH88996.1 polyprotein [Punique virus]